MIRIVLSTRPTAKNLDLCSPGGTRPNAMQTTPADMSLRSVYSFNCPVYNVSNSQQNAEHQSKTTYKTARHHHYASITSKGTNLTTKPEFYFATDEAFIK
jgi:hypothetical protein